MYLTKIQTYSNFVFQLIGFNLAETGKLHDICIFVDEYNLQVKHK